MRTTIDLPDSLFHRAKLVAAQRRMSLKRLITESLESVLNASVPVPTRMVRPPIVLKTSHPIPALSNREIFAILDESDGGKLGRE